VDKPLLTPIELLGAEAIAIHRFLSQHPGNVFTADAIAKEIEAATEGKLVLNRKRVYRAVEKLQGIGVEIEAFKGRSGDRQQGFCIIRGQTMKIDVGQTFVIKDNVLDDVTGVIIVGKTLNGYQAKIFYEGEWIDHEYDREGRITSASHVAVGNHVWDLCAKEHHECTEVQT
jgi:hypothetical protein